MNQGTTKIVALIEGYYPIGECEFYVTVFNGYINHTLHLYGTVDQWRAFGKQLATFPLGIADKVEVELDSISSQTRLILTAYCYDVNGHTAIRVVMSNNDDAPYYFLYNFSIPAEVASINYLGKLLTNWSVENGSEILWEAQTS